MNKEKKMKHPKFGDKVINRFAGYLNPRKEGIFVEVKRKSHKNNYGITHKEVTYRLTDGKGYFWEVVPQAIKVKEQKDEL